LSAASVPPSETLSAAYCLSSIEGAALTAVKIEGVLHEFSSIPGVVEDATDVILNLKQIPLKLHGEEPKTIYLKGTKPGVYTSGDIEHDADLESSTRISTSERSAKVEPSD
jgi:DNA-directed RNA polymerase subunit alpha